MPTTLTTPTLLSLLLAVAATAPAGAGGYLQLCGYSSALGGQLTNQPDNPRDAVSVDLADDVGFDRGLAAEGRAGFLFGRSRLGVAAAIFDHEASRSIAAIDFAGLELAAAARVTNQLRWIEGEYGLALVAEDRVRLEVLAGLRLYHYRGRAEGTALRRPVIIRSEEIEETGPVPHLGVAVELRPAPRLVVRGSGRGLTVAIAGTEGKELDLEGTIGLRLAPRLEIGGGLRRLEVSVDDGETTVDVEYTAVTAYLRLQI